MFCYCFYFQPFYIVIISRIISVFEAFLRSGVNMMFMSDSSIGGFAIAGRTVACLLGIGSCNRLFRWLSGEVAIIHHIA